MCSTHTLYIEVTVATITIFAIASLNSLQLLGIPFFRPVIGSRTLMAGLIHFRFRNHWLVGLLLQGRIDIGIYFRATLIRSSPIDVYGRERCNRQFQTLPTGIIYMVTLHDIVQPTYLAVKNIRLSLHRCLRSLIIP